MRSGLTLGCFFVTNPKITDGNNKRVVALKGLIMMYRILLIFASLTVMFTNTPTPAASRLTLIKRLQQGDGTIGDDVKSLTFRADTLLSMAEILIEYGDLDGAETLVGDAGALTAVTGSAFDSVHEKILRALLARVRGDHARAVMYAFDARQAAA